MVPTHCAGSTAAAPATISQARADWVAPALDLLDDAGLLADAAEPDPLCALPPFDRQRLAPDAAVADLVPPDAMPGAGRAAVAARRRARVDVVWAGGGWAPRWRRCWAQPVSAASGCRRRRRRSRSPPPTSAPAGRTWPSWGPRPTQRPWRPFGGPAAASATRAARRTWPCCAVRWHPRSSMRCSAPTSPTCWCAQTAQPRPWVRSSSPAPGRAAVACSCTGPTATPPGRGCSPSWSAAHRGRSTACWRRLPPASPSCTRWRTSTAAPNRPVRRGCQLGAPARRPGVAPPVVAAPPRLRLRLGRRPPRPAGRPGPPGHNGAADAAGGATRPSSTDGRGGSVRIEGSDARVFASTCATRDRPTASPSSSCTASRSRRPSGTSSRRCCTTPGCAP